MSVRLFMDWLREQRRGALHQELSNALHDLIAKIAESGKSGELLLKITVKPLNNETGGAVSVQDEIVLKLPKDLPPPSVFFVTPENNLSRENVTQPKLELKEVSQPDGKTQAAGG